MTGKEQKQQDTINNALAKWSCYDALSDRKYAERTAASGSLREKLAGTHVAANNYFEKYFSRSYSYYH